jgi:hypothetical protein
MMGAPTLGAWMLWACLATSPLPEGEGMGEGTPVTEAPEKNLHRLELSGRLAGRGLRTEAAEREPTLEYGVSRAKLELDYRYSKWLRIVLEGGVDEGPELQDAYVRLGKKKLGVRLGHFKPPVSAGELESSWDLPVARRGILHGVLIEHARFAGRRPGL